MNFATITPKKSPSAWIDLDALDKNIDIVNKKTSSVNLRIATKSIRSLEIIKYIKSKTPNYIGLMSYSAQESAYLLDNGLDNILCAYPSLDKDSIIDTFAHTERGATMIWMVDRIEHWKFLDRLGKLYGCQIKICLDINMSMPLPKIYFGTKRSSLMYKQQLKKLLKKVKHLKNTVVVGVMGYEGQIAGLPEKIPNKPMLAPAIRILKSRSKKQVSKRRAELVSYLQKQGYNLELINGGGSGSIDFTCSQPEITEITVGSAYYHPALFSNMDSMTEFTPATGFVLQVTRQPEDNVITCQSGGFIASGSVGEDKLPIIHHPTNLRILNDEGFGEVQTPMEAIDHKLTLKIGDYVWCRHAKAGELCEHFNQLTGYRNETPVQEFLTYRGCGKAFH